MSERGYLEAHKHDIKETSALFDEYEESHSQRVKRRMQEREREVYLSRARRVPDDD